jgi:phosphoenolpyruvate synthase/pyruvate phosphate dikinase
VRASLQECGIEAPRPDACFIREIEGMARQRLEQLFLSGMQRARALLDSRRQDGAWLRHEFRTLARIAEVVDAPPEDQLRMDTFRNQLSAHDEDARRRATRRRIAGPGDGGLELAPLTGWKAANLAEMQRLLGPGLVPTWFAVTNFAFEEVLDSPLDNMSPALKEIPPGPATVRAAIDFILARSNLTCAQKSAQIRALWQAVTLPDELSAEVIRSYLQIAPESDQGFVAIRSSALEEDTEAAARAGEFETFLFVSGGQSVIEHLKKTWSGLWTERAIHNRGLFGSESRHAGGGVIVQRIVWSRVSGVLQTVNAARADFGEMVINAGHGLGEGVVSGTVAADQITVMKEGDLERGPLRFRYVTSDKRERVVFDKRTGQGTVRTETLYHQRLRPALEYAELCELVATAARLEEEYGYPLDLEFGIEGTKLWILQARPVASALSCFRQTLDRYPFENKKSDRMRLLQDWSEHV